ncbi:g8465 [Coccomyxa viridis]|uniref:G8465 protein n=1 Tax=Coccomyxa viridis TaxID=1274662 RepID=A0ABP1G0F6_9CHLO
MNSGCGVEVPATDAAGPWKAGGRIGQAVLVAYSAPMPDPPKTHHDVAEGSAEEFVGRETRASRKRKLAGLPSPPVKPPVKMGRKPATPPEILDHALNDLPIIKRSRDHKDMYMLKKALYLNEAYKKFLQYIKAQWEDKPTRSWAKSPGSRAYLDALHRFSGTIVLYARVKRRNPAFAKVYPLSRQADVPLSGLCGKKRRGHGRDKGSGEARSATQKEVC